LNELKDYSKESEVFKSQPRFTKYFKNQVVFIVLIIIGLSIIMTILNRNFLTSRNLFAVLQQVSVLGILSMGQALLMISGGIDFSVGTLMALIAVIVTKLVTLGFNVFLAVFIVMIVAIICGLINGVIVAKSKVMPIIITLGMMYVYYGIALIISGGKNVSFQDKFQFLGRGKVGPIPFMVIVYLLVLVFAFLLFKYTKYGRRLTIIGSNSNTAFLAGINVDLHKISIYTLNGLIAGFAGLVLASRLGTVISTVGNGYELQAVASCIIGGISLAGGSGNVFGAFFGVLLLGILYNGMNIVGVSTYLQTIFLGLIIVITTVVSNINNIRERKG
jgi:ribose transport system permease protein